MCISKLFGGGSPAMPEVPTAPAAPKAQASQATTANRAQDSAARNALRKKKRSTLLTSGMGDTSEAELGRKTLLGQ